MVEVLSTATNPSAVRESTWLALAETNTSAGAPPSICLYSCPDAPKLNTSLTEFSRSNSGPISSNTFFREVAAETFSSTDGAASSAERADAWSRPPGAEHPDATIDATSVASAIRMSITRRLMSGPLLEDGGFVLITQAGEKRLCLRVGVVADEPAGVGPTLLAVAHL